jgi:hypothetical protein
MFHVLSTIIKFIYCRYYSRYVYSNKPLILLDIPLEPPDISGDPPRPILALLIC